MEFKITADYFHVRHRILHFALYFLSTGLCAKFDQIRLFSLALIYIKAIIPFECDSSKLLKSSRFFHRMFFLFADTFDGLRGL